jgi:hypothetical protein
MATFMEIHGISLAANSFIENLNVERLASDPVPVDAGRLWFNTTDKLFKFSGLNSSGAVITRSFYTAEEAAQAVTELEDYADARLDDAKAYTDALETKIMGGVPPGTLDQIAEIAAALKNNPDIVDVITGQIDTLRTDMENAVSDEETRATTAEDGLDGRITTLEGQVNGKIGNLASLNTTEKGTIVGSINEIVQSVADEASARELADGTLQTNIDGLKSSINSGRFTYQSSASATVHTVTHGLGSSFVDVTLWVERDGKYVNDLGAMEEVDTNTVKVTFTSSRKIKLTCQAMDQLA